MNFKIFITLLAFAFITTAAYSEDNVSPSAATEQAEIEKADEKALDSTQEEDPNTSVGSGQSLADDMQDKEKSKELESISDNFFDLGSPQQRKEFWEEDLELFDNEGNPKKIRRALEKKNPEQIVEGMKFDEVDQLKTFEKYYSPPLEIIPEERHGYHWPTEIYRAVLRENSVVHDLKTGRSFTIHRKAYIFAQEEVAGGEVIFVYDKNKQKRFKTNSINVVSIESDLDLKAKPKNYQEFKAPTQYQTKDTTLRLDNFVNFHYEYLQDEYLGDLFSSLLPAGTQLESNTFYAYGTRFELKSFYKWDFPIEFGVNLNYQEGAWQGQAKGLVWRSVFFGPVAQYTLMKNENFSFNVQVSFQQSFFFKARSLTDNFTFNYSTNALELGLNTIWPTRFGDFVIGGSYRRAQASLKETTIPLERNSERGLMQSWSIILGYNFEWEIGQKGVK